MNTVSLRPIGALAQLRLHRDNLPPALQRAADYLLQNSETVIFQSILEVATASSCGQASIIRLCRELGFRGFQDFKLAVAADLAVAAQVPADDSEPAHLIHEALARTQHALMETAQVISAPAIDRAAAALLAAPFTVAVGQGASGITAIDFAYKLTRLGLTCVAHTDPHIAAITVANLRPGSVVIGITRSGSTIDTLSALQVARDTGAVTIAVTHRAASPVTEIADIPLFCAAPEDPLSGGAITSKMGQLLVLEVLFQTMLARHADARTAVHRTAAAVADKIY